MVDVVIHVGTADCDRERLNMSVNAPASWSAHALRTRLGSGPAALPGLTRLNVLLMLAVVKESAQVLVEGHDHQSEQRICLVCLGAGHRGP